MTQPFPEPHHFDSGVGNPSNTPDLLEGRLGIVAVLAAPEAHASGWAAQAAVALAEASQAAGRPTSLMDLALNAPRLHTAAGVVVGEGISDVILFGVSAKRVSRWTPAGVRVLTAGTPVGDSQEIVLPGSSDEDAGWLRTARAVADVDGCVLAYVVADTPEATAILDQVPDVILFRHEGEEVAALPSVPSMVLEPQPVAPEVPDVQALDDAVEVPDVQALDDAVEVPDVQALDDGVSITEAASQDDVLEDLALDDVVLADAPFDDSALESVPGEAATLDDGVAKDDVSEEVVGQDEILEDVAFDDAPVADDDVGVEAVVALDLESALEDADAPEEVILDLDDVAGDSGVDAESILTADLQPTGSPSDVEVDVNVGGLEVDSEWPAFAEPLEVQDPGSVDPMGTAGSRPAGDPKDAGLDDIVAGDSEFSIVPDETFLAGPASPGGVADDVVAGGAMEGLVDSGLGTLEPAGEPSSPSADHVSGLHDPAGWGPPPEAGSEPADSREASADPGDGKRREDPWGEPQEAAAPPIDPTPEPATPDGTQATPSETSADTFPWEERGVAEAPERDADVPVANVTRSRTRTRTKGPRPFLLILFLLLIATVAVLWWAGLLDLPVLDFLRGDPT